MWSRSYNYPCSWANTLSLLGYAQSLLVMSNRVSTSEAFSTLTHDATYRTDVGFYSFVYAYNGACMAHGVKAVTKSRLLTLWEKCVCASPVGPAHRV